MSRFFFCDCPPPDPEVVAKNMLPAFQAPAQFNLPLDAQNFKSGGLYGLDREIMLSTEKKAVNGLLRTRKLDLVFGFHRRKKGQE